MPFRGTISRHQNQFKKWLGLFCNGPDSSIWSSVKLQLQFLTSIIHSISNSLHHTFPKVIQAPYNWSPTTHFVGRGEKVRIYFPVSTKCKHHFNIQSTTYKLIFVYIFVINIHKWQKKNYLKGKSIEIK